MSICFYDKGKDINKILFINIYFKYLLGYLLNKITHI